MKKLILCLIIRAILFSYITYLIFVVVLTPFAIIFVGISGIIESFVEHKDLTYKKFCEVENGNRGFKCK